MNAHSPGIGLYRGGYISHGGAFWGDQPAAFVRLFNEKFSFVGRKVLDLGAGTGRNSFYAVNNGANSCTAIEVDSAAISCFSQRLVSNEESGAINEGMITIVKGDVQRWLKPALQSESFDVVIMYGLAHVFDSFSIVEEILSTLAIHVKGFLIFQSILDTYPAPDSQPELRNKGWACERILKSFKDIGIEVLEVDDTDIVHSHTNEDPLHRHGSLRIIGSLSGALS